MSNFIGLYSSCEHKVTTSKPFLCNSVVKLFLTRGYCKSNITVDCPQFQKKRTKRNENLMTLHFVEHSLRCIKFVKGSCKSIDKLNFNNNTKID